MITPAESKYVGWTGSTIDEYPTHADVAHAERVQLVKWYRFLRSPIDDVEAGIVRYIIKALKSSFPVHEQEQQ